MFRIFHHTCRCFWRDGNNATAPVCFRVHDATASSSSSSNSSSNNNNSGSIDYKYNNTMKPHETSMEELTMAFHNICTSNRMQNDLTDEDDPMQGVAVVN